MPLELVGAFVLFAVTLLAPGFLGGVSEAERGKEREAVPFPEVPADTLPPL
jgi:hypothetical protein